MEFNCDVVYGNGGIVPETVHFLLCSAIGKARRGQSKMFLASPEGLCPPRT